MTTIKIGKTDQTVTVDRDRFPAHVVEYVFNYGLTQILNDCHSQIGKVKDGKPNPDYSDEKVMAAVAAKLEALYAGELRARRGEGKSGDPVADRAWTLAAADVRKALRAAGRKPKDIAEEVFEAAVEKHLAANLDSYMGRAEAMLREEREAAKGVDLSALLG